VWRNRRLKAEPSHLIKAAGASSGVGLFSSCQNNRFRPAGHGVNTLWQPRYDGLSCRHEYIITHGGSASPVRRRRILHWRSRHWRHRAWLGSADMPCRLFPGRVPPEKLISWRMPDYCRAPSVFSRTAGFDATWWRVWRIEHTRQPSGRMRCSSHRRKLPVL